MIIVTVLLTIFVTTVLIVLAIDIVPQFRTWTQRIHIGRWRDPEAWAQKVESVVEDWVSRTPIAPLRDNERLLVIDMLSGSYRRDTIQSWQEAALLLGVGECLRQSPGNSDMRRVVDAWLQRHIGIDGQWKSPPQYVDGALLAYALLKLPGIEVDHYRPALNHIHTLINSMVGSDGTVIYRDFQPNVRYVDTIGFVCPFLTAYGQQFQDENCLELSYRQIDFYSKNAMLPDLFIPAHAIDLSLNAPLGIYGWGRGIAWYALGLMGLLRELPKEDTRRKQLLVYAQRLAQTLVSLQHQKGGWGSMSFLGAHSPLDSSATAVLGLFALRMSKELGLPECRVAAGKSLTYLMSVTRRNGIVDFSQGDTKGLGHYSVRYDQFPFTQGFALLLALEFQDTAEFLGSASE